MSGRRSLCNDEEVVNPKSFLFCFKFGNMCSMIVNSNLLHFVTVFKIRYSLTENRSIKPTLILT